MFCVHWRKCWKSLFCDEMSYRCRLGLTGTLNHLKLVFFFNFLFGLSVHKSEWVFKVLHCYCVTVNFPFHTCLHLPYVLSWSYVGCIYIYSYYIFFLDWSFDHYVASFFVSFHGLFFKVCFIGYEYCYSCYLSVSICMKYLFPALHFQSVCVP